jgi:formylglycine-generating enzyme required for sulfatase activity
MARNESWRRQLAWALLMIMLCIGCAAPPSEPTPPAATREPVSPAHTPLPSPTLPAVEPQAGAARVWEADGAVMVYVPAGTFWMGSREDDPDADSDEYPQHEVYLNGFWIDQMEVTNRQYAHCVAAGACDAPYPSGSHTRQTYYGDPQYADYPVINVSWNDAVDYCQWAGKRLPTEAEWEKAARGTDARKYPWGNTPPDPTLANYGQNEGDTLEVGRYPAGASPYGVLDMAGNVYEWVADRYDAHYYDQSPRDNPTGPSSGTLRTVRSGAWLYVERRIRTNFRSEREPGFRDGTVGFRCASSN